MEKPPNCMQGAHPDVGHAAPTQMRTVVIRLETNQSAKWCNQQGQSHHERHQACGDAHLDNHDAIERAHQHDHGHADRNLKQRQTKQTRQWQIFTGSVCKRQETWTQLTGPRNNPLGSCTVHFENSKESTKRGKALGLSSGNTPLLFNCRFSGRCCNCNNLTCSAIQKAFHPSGVQCQCQVHAE